MKEDQTNKDFITNPSRDLSIYQDAIQIEKGFSLNTQKIK